MNKEMWQASLYHDLWGPGNCQLGRKESPQCIKIILDFCQKVGNITESGESLDRTQCVCNIEY